MGGQRGSCCGRGEGREKGRGGVTLSQILMGKESQRRWGHPAPEEVEELRLGGGRG